MREVVRYVLTTSIINHPSYEQVPAEEATKYLLAQGYDHVYVDDQGYIHGRTHDTDEFEKRILYRVTSLSCDD